MQLVLLDFITNFTRVEFNETVLTRFLLVADSIAANSSIVDSLELFSLLLGQMKSFEV